MVSRVEIDEVRKLKYCGGHPWQTHDTESAAREIHGVEVELRMKIYKREPLRVEQRRSKSFVVARLGP